MSPRPRQIGSGSVIPAHLCCDVVHGEVGLTGGSEALPVIQLRWLVWGLAVDEPIRPPGVEPQRPVASGLQADVANPGCITPSVIIVNLRQRQKPTRMPGVPRPPREPSQMLSVKSARSAIAAAIASPNANGMRESRFAGRWESPA